MVVAALQQDALSEALIRALINDGFRMYRFGPEALPTARVFAYEWPDCVDVVTLPLDGTAAAARLVKPADVLDPPDTAAWASEGKNSDATIWTLLHLPAPGSPDAPSATARTPLELRVPDQGNPDIQWPDVGKVEARAARLMGPRSRKKGDVLRRLLGQVDAGAAIAASEDFTPDGQVYFAEFPVLNGPTAIVDFILDHLHANFSAVKHVLYRHWEVERRTVSITQGGVRFTRHDGTVADRNFATVSHFNPDRLITEHRVIVNLAGVMSG